MIWQPGWSGKPYGPNWGRRCLPNLKAPRPAVGDELAQVVLAVAAEQLEGRDLFLDVDEPDRAFPRHVHRARLVVQGIMVGNVGERPLDGIGEVARVLRRDSLP